MYNDFFNFTIVRFKNESRKRNRKWVREQVGCRDAPASHNNKLTIQPSTHLLDNALILLAKVRLLHRHSLLQIDVIPTISFFFSIITISLKNKFKCISGVYKVATNLIEGNEKQKGKGKEGKEGKGRKGKRRLDWKNFKIKKKGEGKERDWSLDILPT